MTSLTCCCHYKCSKLILVVMAFNAVPDHENMSVRRSRFPLPLESLPSFLIHALASLVCRTSLAAMAIWGVRRPSVRPLASFVHHCFFARSSFGRRSFVEFVIWRRRSAPLALCSRCCLPKGDDEWMRTTQVGQVTGPPVHKSSNFRNWTLILQIHSIFEVFVEPVKKIEFELELWFQSPFYSLSKCTKSSI